MKFQCKQTKQVYEFLAEHDIKQMQQHPDYEVFVEEEQTAKKPRKSTTTQEE